jgi:two-component system sensor histidine kinase RpfC
MKLAPGQKFLLQLSDNFDHDSNQLLQAMSEAVEAQDFTHLRELIHALKGSAINLGLRQLFELAVKTEGLSDEHLTGEGNYYVAALGTALEQAKAALAREIRMSPAERS